MEQNNNLCKDPNDEKGYEIVYDQEWIMHLSEDQSKTINIILQPAAYWKMSREGRRAFIENVYDNKHMTTLLIMMLMQAKAAKPIANDKNTN